MKITVFTSNRPRHLALLRSLSQVAEVVYSVQECVPIDRTAASGTGKKSDVIKHYFSLVDAAEKQVFGGLSFLPRNVLTIALTFGDLGSLAYDVALQEALESDYFVVFGCSWIKGALCDFLQEKHAVNLHPGVCPFYRGMGCNFWCMYDSRPDLVGCTVHLLTSSLDNGQILFHALPPSAEADPFMIGMRAVAAGIEGLKRYIQDGSLETLDPVAQSALGNQLRYVRRQDFKEPVVLEYLSRLPTPKEMLDSLRQRDLSKFVRPFVY